MYYREDYASYSYYKTVSYNLNLGFKYCFKQPKQCYLWQHQRLDSSFLQSWLNKDDWESKSNFGVSSILLCIHSTAYKLYLHRTKVGKTRVKGLKKKTAIGRDRFNEWLQDFHKVYHANVPECACISPLRCNFHARHIEVYQRGLWYRNLAGRKFTMNWRTPHVLHKILD